MCRPTSLRARTRGAQYESLRGRRRWPLPTRGDAACRELLYEIGVVVDADAHVVMIARSAMELGDCRGRERDEQRQDRREEEDLADPHHLRVRGEQIHEEAANKGKDQQVCQHAAIVGRS